ncbi:alpha-defensin 1-like [Phyllostomus hastatus]|uniref:alpha-defensin 1-like n=1 Tax=Phyllostomus hastatus TaxID=9423 RepID=UPI001E67FE7B|nr:alpha-defensin 1-like [Phyllostomus hastatus]
MRTLVLFAALLLLAFQAQAGTLQETTDQVPTQDQPEVEHQHQPGDEDQDVAVSFTGEERITREAAGLPVLRICRCQRGLFCKPTERPSGKCSIRHRRYTRCCR